MTCTGNCLQGRACTCWRQDWADKRAYQSTPAELRHEIGNWLAIVTCVLLVALVAAGWL